MFNFSLIKISRAYAYAQTDKIMNFKATILRKAKGHEYEREWGNMEELEWENRN